MTINRTRCYERKHSADEAMADMLTAMLAHMDQPRVCAFLDAHATMANNHAAALESLHDQGQMLIADIIREREDEER